MNVAEYQKLLNCYDDSLDEVSQVGFLMVEMFNKSYDEVDNLTQKQFLKYSKKIEKTFNRLHKKPFWYFGKLNTDAKKITLGQFIEIQHWLKMAGDKEMLSLHLIVASLMKQKDHAATANKVIRQNVRFYFSDVVKFLQSFQELLSEYKGLFESDEIEDEEPKKPHYFVEQYGWIFSATEVAKHNGLKLDDAFELPIVQALNDLSYLKAQQQYYKWLEKQ